MKTAFVGLLILASTNSGGAQTLSPLSFFPHRVSDFWEYFVLNGIGNDTLQVWVTLDSTDQNGNTYVRHNMQEIDPTQPAINYPWFENYRIDTLARVFATGLSYYNSLRYELNAGLNKLWITDSFGVAYEIARVKGVYQDTLFGVASTVKEIWYYTTSDTSDTTLWLWQYTEVLSDSFGVVFRGGGDLGYELYIRGAIIDGHLFGDTTLVSVRDFPGLSIPSQIQLFQNYPNPFNPSTVIRYSLPTNTSVSLKVFNILGQEVQNLVNERQIAGMKSVRLDGIGLPSGVYFYQLTAGKFSQVKKLVLVK